MEPKLEKLHIVRSLSFQDIALIELAVNRLICLYFIGKNTDKRFIEELLQHAHFSFELRKRIFKKIYKEKYPESKFPWRALEEIQKLRNIVAHGRIDRINDNESETLYYMYHTEKIACVDLHKTFNEYVHEITQSLDEIKHDTGITFKIEEPVTL